jgi:hypothetical protein
LNGSITRTDRKVEGIAGICRDDKVSRRPVDEEGSDLRYYRRCAAFVYRWAGQVDSDQLVRFVKIDDDDAERLDGQYQEVVGCDEGDNVGRRSVLDERKREEWR